MLTLRSAKVARREAAAPVVATVIALMAILFRMNTEKRRGSSAYRFDYAVTGPAGGGVPPNSGR
jgi:hypothetical protein